MKKLFTLTIFLLTCGNAFSQYSVRAGMGITFINIASLTDYLNGNGIAPPNQQVGTFSSAISFSGEFDYSLNPTAQLGIEMNYLINSYNYNYTSGLYKMSYGLVMPSVLYYYVVAGAGYSFKFGGGAGIRLASVNQQFQATPNPQTFTSTGFGILLRADGNTLISDNLYANVGLDLRYDFNGKPKSGSQYLVNNSINQNVNFNSLSAGIRLGVSYTF